MKTQSASDGDIMSSKPPSKQHHLHPKEVRSEKNMDKNMEKVMGA